MILLLNFLSYQFSALFHERRLRFSRDGGGRLVEQGKGGAVEEQPGNEFLIILLKLSFRNVYVKNALTNLSDFTYCGTAHLSAKLHGSKTVFFLKP